MEDLVLSIMEDSEDVDFILSSDTAFDVAKDLIEDGIEFEEMKEWEVIDEINKSVAVILSQVLTKDGYIYYIENYLLDNGAGKLMDGADVVFIDEEIEDLVDPDKIESEVVIVITEDIEENCDCECFEVGFQEGYNQALEDASVDSVNLTDNGVVVVELQRRFSIDTIKKMSDKFKEAFPDNEVLIYCVNDINLKIINKN